MAESEAPYRFEEADSYCVITLLPELNQAPWGDINKIGTSLLQSMRTSMESHKKSPAFLVDLSNLHYIGSAMVALVVRLWKAVKEKDGRMAVVNNDDNVLEVLRLSGLEEVWTITETREAGLKSLGIAARKIVPQPSAESGQPAGVAATPASAAHPNNPSGGLCAIVALVLLVIALIGLFLFTATPPPIADLRIGMGMLFGSCVLALVAGSVAASRGIGLPKTLGVTIVVGAFALLVTGIACHPQRDAVLLKPVQQPEQIDETPPQAKGNAVRKSDSVVGKSQRQSKSPARKSVEKTKQKTSGKTAKTLGPPNGKTGPVEKTVTPKKPGSVEAKPPKKTGTVTAPALPAKPK